MLKYNAACCADGGLDITSRAESGYLRRFPWLSGFVLKSISLAEITPAEHHLKVRIIPSTKYTRIDVSQFFAKAAQDHVQSIFSNYDQETRKLRCQLQMEATVLYPSSLRERCALTTDSGDEPTKKTASGLFHLILVLRLLDFTLFHENNRGGGNVVKVPKHLSLKSCTDLSASMLDKWSPCN